ncbi:7TMR-DISM family protein, partial [Leptospira bourretii]|uniref:7TMR-DISM family protein n=1 Tax=Leptospira bourretii TaxID=2484962 RepID=UPI00248D1A3A
MLSEPAVLLSQEITGKSIWSDVLVLEDKDQSISEETITNGSLDSKFQKISSPNLGFSKSTFWIRVLVTNPTEDTIRWNLVFDFPLLDEIQIFGNEFPKSFVRTLGDIHPFSERNLDYRNPVFPLETKSGVSSVYYLKISSESTIPLTMSIWTEREFYDQLNKEQWIFGLFYGILFVMIAYNFFIYIFTYEKSYLFYMFFVSSIFFFHFINNGFAFQYLWPNWIYWANYSLPFFICVSCITGLIFSDNYLNLKKHLPKISKLMWVWAG